MYICAKLMCENIGVSAINTEIDAGSTKVLIKLIGFDKVYAF